MHPKLDARRALCHPLWWCALVLFIANDHLFKRADVLPSAVTGKLSDFAGLLVAPAVLAVLLGVNRRWGWTVAHVLTGAVFVAINLSPQMATAFEWIMAHTPFPWSITVDPVDLIALPALALSWSAFGAWARRPLALRPLLWRLGVSLGAVASLATSPPPDPMCEAPGACGACWETDQCDDIDRGERSFDAVFSLQNQSASPQVFRVRALRETVALDCDTVATNPSAFLPPSLFGPASVWVVDPRRGLPLPGSDTAELSETECTALFIDGPGMPRILVFWSVAQFPARWITDAEGNAAIGERARMIFLRESETGLSVDPHPRVFPMGTDDDTLVEPICAAPEEGTTLGWTQFPPGDTHQIERLSMGADGCNAFEFTGARWYLCAPGVLMPFEEGDTVRFGPLSSENGPDLGGFRLDGPRGGIEVSVGAHTASSAPAIAAPIDGCGYHRDTCGGAVRPLALTFETATRTQVAHAGQHVDLDDDTTAYLFRAQTQAVVDSDCAAGAANGAPRIELVVVTSSEEDQEETE